MSRGGMRSLSSLLSVAVIVLSFPGVIEAGPEGSTAIATHVQSGEIFQRSGKIDGTSGSALYQNSGTSIEVVRLTASNQGKMPVEISWSEKPYAAPNRVVVDGRKFKYRSHVTSLLISLSPGGKVALAPKRGVSADEEVCDLSYHLLVMSSSQPRVSRSKRSLFAEGGDIDKVVLAAQPVEVLHNQRVRLTLRGPYLTSSGESRAKTFLADTIVFRTDTGIELGKVENYAVAVIFYRPPDPSQPAQIYATVSYDGTSTGYRSKTNLGFPTEVRLQTESGGLVWLLAHLDMNTWILCRDNGQPQQWATQTDSLNVFDVIGKATLSIDPGDWVRCR